MVFAVPQLEQPLLAHRPIPARCRAIDPHACGLQVVHPHDLPGQGCFEALPLLVIAQGIQHNAQSIITPFPIANCLPAASVQRLYAIGHPRLYLIHPVIAFRQNVRQPDRCRPAQTRSLPVPMRLKVVIHQLWYTHFVALRQQDRNIVHSFCRHGKLFCHAGSLSQFQNVVTIWPNHE